jgi:hypothetical protein
MPPGKERLRTMNLRVREFEGQPVLIDLENRVLYFHHKRPFYAAGRILNLSRRGPALSLNMAILNYAINHSLKIRILVGDVADRVYEADAETWLTCGKRYSREGVELIALPWRQEYFKTVREFPSEVLKQFKLVAEAP